MEGVPRWPWLACFVPRDASCVGFHASPDEVAGQAGRGLRPVVVNRLAVRSVPSRRWPTGTSLPRRDRAAASFGASGGQVRCEAARAPTGTVRRLRRPDADAAWARPASSGRWAPLRRVEMPDCVSGATGARFKLRDEASRELRDPPLLRALPSGVMPTAHPRTWARGDDAAERSDKQVGRDQATVAPRWHVPATRIAAVPSAAASWSARAATSPDGITATARVPGRDWSA